MTTYDIIFWLLIVLIVVLAFSIESGLSTRHRPLVLSSILSATLAAIYMMFLVEDNSEFAIATGKRSPAGQGGGMGGGGLGMGAGGGGGGLMGGPMASGMGGGMGGGMMSAPVGGMGGGGMASLDGGGASGYATNSFEAISRYEDAPLLKQPGGFRDCPACPLMMMMPAGQFIMGSPETEAGRQANEGPQKLVGFARPFAMSRYEIQYNEFAAFVLETRYTPAAKCMVNGKPGSMTWKSRAYDDKAAASHPVVCLTSQDAGAYAKWLTEKTGREYRLPSESQWEYSARGGGATPYWTGKDITAKQANFAGTRKGTSSAGKFVDNGFNLFDTAGNVWEMADDCWSDDLSKVLGSGVSERGLGDCQRLPIRGGAFDSAKPMLRSAFRTPIGADQAFSNVGFRLAREIK